MWYTIFSIVISAALVVLVIFLVRTLRNTQRTQAWLLREERILKKQKTQMRRNS